MKDTKIGGLFSTLKPFMLSMDGFVPVLLSMKLLYIWGDLRIIFCKTSRSMSLEKKRKDDDENCLDINFTLL